MVQGWPLDHPGVPGQTNAAGLIHSLAVGLGTVNLNTALGKSFALGERFKFKVEGSFTNVLNHVNLADPQLAIDSASFGQITSARGSDFGGYRTGQVSGRLEF